MKNHILFSYFNFSTSKTSLTGVTLSFNLKQKQQSLFGQVNTKKLGGLIRKIFAGHYYVPDIA